MSESPRQGKMFRSIGLFFQPPSSLFSSQRYYGSSASGTGHFPALARMREHFGTGKQDGVGCSLGLVIS